MWKKGDFLISREGFFGDFLEKLDKNRVKSGKIGYYRGFFGKRGILGYILELKSKNVGHKWV